MLGLVSHDGVSVVSESVGGLLAVDERGIVDAGLGRTAERRLTWCVSPVTSTHRYHVVGSRDEPKGAEERGPHRYSDVSKVNTDATCGVTYRTGLYYNICAITVHIHRGTMHRVHVT